MIEDRCSEVNTPSAAELDVCAMRSYAFARITTHSDMTAPLETFPV